MKLLQSLIKWFCILGLACVFSLPVYGFKVPALKARVNDYAHLLNVSTVTKLEKKLEKLEQKNGTQVAILTVNSLDGESVEEVALQIANAWGLGQKEKNNGVLFLIAKNDRAIRIEVGMGLENLLTDVKSGQLIDLILVPTFKSQNFEKGLLEATDILVEQLTSDASGPILSSKASIMSKPILFHGGHPTKASKSLHLTSIFTFSLASLCCMSLLFLISRKQSFKDDITIKIVATSILGMPILLTLLIFNFYKIQPWYVVLSYMGGGLLVGCLFGTILSIYYGSIQDSQTSSLGLGRNGRCGNLKGGFQGGGGAFGGGGASGSF